MSYNAMADGTGFVYMPRDNPEMIKYLSPGKIEVLIEMMHR